MINRREKTMKRYTPFHCGSQGADWESSNCERCTKNTNGMPTCPIQQALFGAYVGDGTVSEEIAERMGFLDNSPPRQEKFSYGWICGEVEWTEEWKEEWYAAHPEEAEVIREREARINEFREADQLHASLF